MKTTYEEPKNETREFVKVFLLDTLFFGICVCIWIYLRKKRDESKINDNIYITKSINAEENKTERDKLNIKGNDNETKKKNVSMFRTFLDIKDEKIVNTEIKYYLFFLKANRNIILSLCILGTFLVLPLYLSLPRNNINNPSFFNYISAGNISDLHILTILFFITIIYSVISYTFIYFLWKKIQPSSKKTKKFLPQNFTIMVSRIDKKEVSAYEIYKYFCNLTNNKVVSAYLILDYSIVYRQQEKIFNAKKNLKMIKQTEEKKNNKSYSIDKCFTSLLSNKKKKKKKKTGVSKIVDKNESETPLMNNCKEKGDITNLESSMLEKSFKDSNERINKKNSSFMHKNKSSEKVRKKKKKKKKKNEKGEKDENENDLISDDIKKKKKSGESFMRKYGNEGTYNSDSNSYIGNDTSEYSDPSKCSDNKSRYSDNKSRYSDNRSNMNVRKSKLLENENTYKLNTSTENFKRLGNSHIKKGSHHMSINKYDHNITDARYQTFKNEKYNNYTNMDINGINININDTKNDTNDTKHDRKDTKNDRKDTKNDRKDTKNDRKDTKNDTNDIKNDRKNTKNDINGVIANINGVNTNINNIKDNVNTNINSIKNNDNNNNDLYSISLLKVKNDENELLKANKIEKKNKKKNNYKLDYDTMLEKNNYLDNTLDIHSKCHSKNHSNSHIKSSRYNHHNSHRTSHHNSHRTSHRNIHMNNHFNSHLNNNESSGYDMGNITTKDNGNLEMDLTEKKRKKSMYISEYKKKKNTLQNVLYVFKRDKKHHWKKKLKEYLIKFYTIKNEIPKKSTGVCFVSFIDTKSVHDCIHNIPYTERNNWLIYKAPPNYDIIWKNLKNHSYKVCGRFIIFNAMLLLANTIIIFSVTYIDNIIKIKIKQYESVKNFIGVIILQLAIWCSSFIVIIINSIVQPALITGVSMAIGFLRKSSEHTYVLQGNFIFLLYNTIIIPLFSLSPLSSLIKIIYSKEAHPWTTNLGSELFNSSCLFALRYLLHCCFLTCANQLLQIPQFSIRSILKTLTKKEISPWSFDFGYWYGFNTTMLALILTFSVAVPLILPLGSLYFFLRYYIDKYNLIYEVCKTNLDSHGAIVKTAIKFMLFSVAFFQIVMFIFFSQANDSFILVGKNILFLSSSITTLLLLCRSTEWVSTNHIKKKKGKRTFCYLCEKNVYVSNLKDLNKLKYAYANPYEKKW
ncbi:conserved membrane protein, unknown function [Hepatocystis sp. ex Piliocolobus tephrosceles]|nr:conserved membrane protein, unknown function [Hepatocystis sp. ex Piliocolobus tephrosceles]